MSQCYSYENQKEDLFTENGVSLLLKIHKVTEELLDKSGAFRLGNALDRVTGDSWEKMACVDHLVKEKYLLEFPSPSGPGQHRVFVRHPSQE